MDDIQDFYNKLAALPILDRDLGLKLAGNNLALANDMLNAVIDSLPQNLDIIKSVTQPTNHELLIKTIHKLHGAVCYIGTPRLKLCLTYLETRLKRNIMDDLLSLITQLENEVNLLLEHHSRLQNRSSMQD